MTAPINLYPRVVSVFGDSWSTQVRDKALPYVSDFKAAFATGLGWSTTGTNYLAESFSYGGVSAWDAANGTGNFPLAIDSPNTNFANAAPHDFALYQVFRYGINDVGQNLMFNLDPNPGRSDYAQFSAQLTAAGLDVAHNVVNSTKWAAFRTAFRQRMVDSFDSLVGSSKAVGRRPVLAKMPIMTPMATGNWKWTARHQELMVEVNSAVDIVVTYHNIRAVNQTDSTLSAAQRVDYAHANVEFAYRLGVDFGQKLRIALNGY